MFRRILVVMLTDVGLSVGSLMVLGILIFLLLPVGVMRPEPPSTSFARLRHIGIAFQSHAAATGGTFPARANFDKLGRPLLSWRVHLLPYIDEMPLYTAFHLDEPWDSKHNKELIPLMPRDYANPSGKGQPGMTNYLAVCGKGLMFDGKEGRKQADLKNSTSSIIMLVEADDDHAVIWTKPDDWQFDPQHPMAGLGHAHPGGFFHAGGFNVLNADASVRFIDSNIDPKAFQAMLPIAGGEKAGRPK